MSFCDPALSAWLLRLQFLHPVAIDLALDRIRSVAFRLGVLDWSIPVITVAGTNGKGSCVRFMECVFQDAGYTCGVYTSPHLIRFNERIRVGGIEIQDSDCLAAFEAVEAARDGVSLTYFEYTTLAALHCFRQVGCNLLILEVGLGGRLDAVNIVDPSLCVITTIDLDHQDWLGDTRELIAREKAGIFRPGIPVVCGDPDPPHTLVDAARAYGAPFYQLGVDFRYLPSSDCWTLFLAQDSGGSSCVLPMPVLPIQNAATALMAIHLMRERLPVVDLACASGIARASLAGRMQYFSEPFALLLDVAHNPQSARFLADRWALMPISGRRVALVGMLADKDIASTLAALVPWVDDWLLVGGLADPRAASPLMLAAHLDALGVQAYRCYDSPLEAFEAARLELGDADCLLAFGSFSVVGPLLSELEAAGFSSGSVNQFS